MSSYAELQPMHFQTREQNLIQFKPFPVGRMQNRRVRKFVELRRNEETFDAFPKFGAFFTACGVSMLACEILSERSHYTYLLYLASGLLLLGNSIPSFERCVSFISNPIPISFTISPDVQGHLFPLEGRVPLEISNNRQLIISSDRNFLTLKQGGQWREFREKTTGRVVSQIFQYITCMYSGSLAGLFVLSFGDCEQVTTWGSDNEDLIFILLIVSMTMTICTMQKKRVIEYDLDQLSAQDSSENESAPVQIEEV